MTSCCVRARGRIHPAPIATSDRKSTRLNSSHLVISYAVFCLKKKKVRHPDPGCGHLLVLRGTCVDLALPDDDWKCPRPLQYPDTHIWRLLFGHYDRWLVWTG